MTYEDLWRRMQRLMREKDMTLSQLAERSRVSRTYLYKIGRGDAHPSIDVLRDLSRALGVHNADLLGQMYSDYIRPIPALGRPEKYKKFESAFVRDVTYPDNSAVAWNQWFEKTWEIQNVGKHPWEGFYLVNVDDPKMPGFMWPLPPAVPLERVEPGQTVLITVQLRAPGYAGSFISRWKMIDSDGELVFPDKDGIWCQIVVEDM
jgi:transcriptional regulator with XRE-family HTH domain